MRRLAPVLLLLCLAACRAIDKAEGAAAEVVLPPDQEKQLGAQVQAQVEKQAKVLNDREITDYVARVGQKVVAASPNPDHWQFNFKVLDDPKQVNAFNIPGGTIYVYTGLLRMAQNEAQLAGVLAHEVAHQTSRHIAKRLVQVYGLQALAAIALGQDPSLLEQIAASIAAQGALLKNSRDDETEADDKGVVAMSKAGYDPMALVTFFEMLQGQQGKTPAVLSFLSDHPATADRIARLERIINEQHLTGGGQNVADFDAIKKKVG